VWVIPKRLLLLAVCITLALGACAACITWLLGTPPNQLEADLSPSSRYFVKLWVVGASGHEFGSVEVRTHAAQFTALSEEESTVTVALMPAVAEKIAASIPALTVGDAETERIAQGESVALTSGEGLFSFVNIGTDEVVILTRHNQTRFQVVLPGSSSASISRPPELPSSFARFSVDNGTAFDGAGLQSDEYHFEIQHDGFPEQYATASSLLRIELGAAVVDRRAILFSHNGCPFSDAISDAAFVASYVEPVDVFFSAPVHRVDLVGFTGTMKIGDSSDRIVLTDAVSFEVSDGAVIIDEAGLAIRGLVQRATKLTAHSDNCAAAADQSSLMPNRLAASRTARDVTLLLAGALVGVALGAVLELARRWRPWRLIQ